MATVVDFGISAMPPEGMADEEYLDQLADWGHTAHELPFVKGFPWKERRCASFGKLAAERGIRLSIHAPYFATLTHEDPERGAQCASAIEHTMKLAAAMDGHTIVVHGGATHEEPADVLMDRIRERIDRIAPKVSDLGVRLGLETAGRDGAWGTLGDLALVTSEYRFVSPVVDWAHLHAITRGALADPAAFDQIFEFLETAVPAWMLNPLHCHFTDNLVGERGEIRHLPYGEGTLRVGPVVEAAARRGVSLVLISEAREQSSHDAIRAEATERLAQTEVVEEGRLLATRATELPAQVRVVEEGDRFRPLGISKPLTLSNIDKVFFPDDGYNKGDLIQYYSSISDLLLPHLVGRPLSMSRYPDGIEGSTFYEKRAPGHQPDWMETTPVPSDSQGGEIEFVLAHSREALMWFAGMGCIEIHPFHSQMGSLEYPTHAVFDFDPAEGSTWEQVVSGVRLLGEALKRLGLSGVPKLSGSRGMHVYVPLGPGHDHARVRHFVDALGRVMVGANPDDLTMAWDKKKRTGKVFIDANRNASGQTIASVYSVRPRPGAPVSAPLRWDEVGSVANGDITMLNIWDRIRRHGDLFAPVLSSDQTLDAAEEALSITR
ncbi:MAG: TIM barrel protein [Acidimicrobiia bacterium]|nr:TIM barrel protein [Acidimicrobiia bacterium]